MFPLLGIGKVNTRSLKIHNSCIMIAVNLFTENKRRAICENEYQTKINAHNLA